MNNKILCFIAYLSTANILSATESPYIVSCLNHYVDSMGGTTEIVDQNEETTTLTVVVPNSLKKIKPIEFTKENSSTRSKSIQKDGLKVMPNLGNFDLAELSKLQNTVTSFMQKLQNGNLNPEERDELLNFLKQYMGDSDEFKQLVAMMDTITALQQNQ